MHLRRLLPAVSFVGLLGVLVVPAQRHAVQPPPGRRIVLVGIDAADWIAIDPLIATGKLPTFERLKSRGRSGVLLSTPPLISPMIWTTIATGVEPENHGVLDFTVDLANGRQAPVGSSQRLAPALWNLFSHAGRRVSVVGWWATWPSEQVNGTIVSDALAPQLTRTIVRSDAGLVSPAGSSQRLLSEVVRVDALTAGDLSAYAEVTPEQLGAIGARRPGPSALYHDPIAHLAAVVAGTRTYTAIARKLVRSEPAAFVAVYLEAVDTLSHLFVKPGRGPRGPRAIERAYQDADELLRRLAEESAGDALFVVCSDHGFHPATAGVRENPADLTGPATAWHRPYGIVAVATARMLASDSPDSSLPGPSSIGVVTPLDVAPTILHAAGLPIPADMPGRVIREMLPVDTQGQPPVRGPAPPFTRVAAPDRERADSEDVVARLQALGYVGAARTSLARQNLGESLLRRGKLAAAERELRAVLESQPGNLFAHLWLAQALLRQGRPAAALATYERALGLPGGAREALTAAVDLAIQTGDLTLAGRVVRTAEATPDVGAAALVARGALAEARGDLRRAEAHYRRALDDETVLFDASARLVDLLAAAGRRGEALAIAERALRAAPDSPRQLALAGQARLAARDAAGAEKALRRALALAPDGDAVRLELGRALMAQNRTDEALAAIEAAGPSPDRDVLLGAAYSRRREFQLAIKHLRSAIDGGRTTPEVLNGAGYAYLQLGRREEAAAMFERSLAAKPNQPDIKRLLTQIRSSKGVTHDG